MVISIGKTLSYKIAADTSGFTTGMTATRRELHAATKVMEETRTPLERLTLAAEHLNTLYKKGAISQEHFKRSMQQLKDQHPKNIKAAKERAQAEKAAADAVRAAEQRRQRIMEDGKQITRGVETASERYGRELRHLRRRLRQGAITQETYNRRIKEMRLEKLRGIPVVGRLAAMIRGAHPATLAAGVAIAGIATAAYAAQKAMRAMTRVVKEQLKELDKLAKTSEKLGVSATGLVGLRQAAAEFSGMEAPQFDMALQRMTRRIAEAAAGTGEAKQVIADLGLDAVTLNAAGSEEAFKRIADAIQDVENPADRLRIAFKLFDSEGASLATTLSKGRKEIEGVQGAMSRAYGDLRGRDLQAVQQAHDAMSRSAKTLAGLGARLTVNVAPSVEALAKMLSEAADDSTALGRSVRDGIGAIGEMAPGAINALQMLVGFLQVVEGRLLQIPAAIRNTEVAWDQFKAKLTGGDRDPNLAMEAYALTRAAKERIAAGQARRDAAMRGEYINEIRNTQNAMNTSISRGAQLTREEVEQTVKLTEQMEKARKAAADTVTELQRQLDVSRMLATSDPYALGGAPAASRAERYTEAQRQIAGGLDPMIVASQLAGQEALATAQAERTVQEAVTQTARSLQDQMFAATLTREQMEIYRLEQQATALGMKGLTDAQVAQIKSMQAWRKLAEDSAKAERKQADAMREGAALTKSLMTPTEQLASQLASLRELWVRGAISLTTYYRALKKARDEHLEFQGVTGADVGIKAVGATESHFMELAAQQNARRADQKKREFEEALVSGKTPEQLQKEAEQQSRAERQKVITVIESIGRAVQIMAGKDPVEVLEINQI